MSTHVQGVKAHIPPGLRRAATCLPKDKDVCLGSRACRVQGFQVLGALGAGVYRCLLSKV